MAYFDHICPKYDHRWPQDDHIWPTITANYDHTDESQLWSLLWHVTVQKHVIQLDINKLNMTFGGIYIYGGTLGSLGSDDSSIMI